jgi:hypothetical protein
MASAQNEPSQDTMRTPTGVESTAPNNPPVATVPEAATDTPRALAPQTSGQAPNVSRKMGAETRNLLNMARACHLVHKTALDWIAGLFLVSEGKKKLYCSLLPGAHFLRNLGTVSVKITPLETRQGGDIEP